MTFIIYLLQHIFFKYKKMQFCAFYDVARALGGTVKEKSISYVLLIYFVDIFVEILISYRFTLLFN